jgi:hypothetical protein
MQAKEANREQEIRQLAYKLWQDAGCPHGQDVTYWLTAESLWLDERRRQVSPPAKATRGRKKSAKGLADTEL